MDVQNKVVKKDDKWYVYSEDGGKKLGGPYDTEEEADKRLKQIEYFKHNPKNQFVRVLFNTTPKLVRNDKLADKDYVVVPMVMLTEGVHEGSEGAFYYPKEENTKRVELWNMKPVVVYHPEEPSACTPAVLNARQIGIIMNAKAEKDGKIKAEAWLDETRVKKVDKRVWDSIQNESTLELSTGLFADSDELEGEWSGEKYKGTLRNYGPDHLAVLPDQVGACSVQDGAGFYRNEKGELVANGGAGSGNFGHEGRPGEIGGSGGGGGGGDRSADGVAVEKEKLIREVSESSDDKLTKSFSKAIKEHEKAKKAYFGRPGSGVASFIGKTKKIMPYESDTLKGDPEKDYLLAKERLDIIGGEFRRRNLTLRAVQDDLTEQELSAFMNELSANSLREQLQSLITVKGGEPGKINNWQYVEDIYPESSYFIYSAEGGLHKQGYKQDGDKVYLDGAAEKVVRKFTYEPVKNNEDKPIQNVKESLTMDKKKIVDGLIANKKFDEKDRAVLEAMPDEMLTRLEKSVQNAEPPKVDPPKVTEPPVVSQPVKPKNMEEYLKDMPPEMRKIVENAQKMERQEKDRLIAVITKNPKNTFTGEYLATKDIEELTNLANLAVSAEDTSVQNVIQLNRFNYSGQGDPIQNDSCDGVPVLEPPTYKAQKKTA